MHEIIEESLPLVITFAILFALIVVAISLNDEKGEKFIQECQQEHTKYECIAMWRGGY